MAEENIKEVIEEIKNADEEAIEKWFESTRTDGMKLGARLISAAVFGAIQKHLKKKAKPSLRDYQRAVDEVIKIVAVQLTPQKTLEENENDGTTDSNDNTDS